MIVFTKIKWRNFLSTGNSWNEVDLNRSTTTLIIGKNGEGKSTILDALCFGLFGKPFRNVKNQQLINSINQKNSEVELHFSVGGQNYRINRSMKPFRFYIYQNDVQLNQDASKLDYQGTLEKQILRLNYKTFTQMVILGSASFVPFMQLRSYDRRKVIEDILDISIFSSMNELLKQRVNETRDAIKDAENQIALARQEVDAQQRVINSMSTAKDEMVDRIKVKIKDHQEEIDIVKAQIEEVSVETKALSDSIADADDIKKRFEQAKTLLADSNFKKSEFQKSMAFFVDNDVCPSCQQGIEHEHKNNLIEDLKSKSTSQEDAIKTLSTALERLNARLEKISAVNMEIMEKNNIILTNNSTITHLNEQITRLNKEAEEVTTDTSNIDVEKDKLKKLAATAVATVKKKTSLQERSNIEAVSSTLLRDNGVKTAIIREYIPVINKLINKYLQAMDFYVHFELDENFNETIKSRYRDEFTYASFSEGEKMRIDLAILFTWRQIAKMKNSINTNLLILDEIFDSSLDAAGTDYFLNVLDATQDSSNVFVISHKGDQLFDKFRSVIRFEKKNDFSVIAKGT